MNFTDSQQLAIFKEGTNIIVSAGAGSGKTAVLTERVIRKLKNGVDLDKLLILTFTNEAAKEMKDRIRKSIVKNNLLNQLNLIDSAYITTFDSFALALVKKYNYLLNITNDIKIIDANIITIEKHKIIDRIFEEKYGSPSFDKMVGDFCVKDDSSLKEFVIQVSDKLDLLVDKNEYLNNYITREYSDENIDKLLNSYIKLIHKKVNELNHIYQNLISYCQDKLIDKLDAWTKILFESQSYDEYVLFTTIPPVKFIGLDENGKELKEKFKEKISEITELLRFKTKEEIKESIIKTKDYIKEIIDIIIELNKEIDIYKDKYQVFEFNDISHKAIYLVKNNSTVREEIKNSFNEIMIDEYQDTSTLQETFINYIENNNVYMVGDIKQSIYRFRNANPYIFQKKYNEYQNNNGGIKIDLVENFRSRKETLFNINEMFNLIMDDAIGNANYIESHNMKYGNIDYDNEDTKHDNNLEIYTYNMEDDDKFTKEEKEIFIISEDIQDKIKNKYQIFDKKTKKLRDLKYSDICIITDRNKYLITYRKILEYNKIPSVIYMDEELNNDNVILVIKNLINLIVQVNENTYDVKTKYMYTSVARSFIFKYSDDKIYDILTNKTLCNDEIIKKCKEINIDKPLPDIINSIIKNFEIYQKLTNLSDIEKNIIRIDNLINISNNVTSLGYNLNDFIEYLDNTNKMGLSVKYSQVNSSANAVKIMNIHKSKGLEFSLCYFTGMHNKFTIKEITSKYLVSNKYRIILPYQKDEELHDTILKNLYQDEYYQEEISEKIRLLYVALTRSREKMIILANIEDEYEGFNHLVPYEERIKYRSFLDIIKSLNILKKYTIQKTANYTDEYKKNRISNIIKEKSKEKIINKTLNIEYAKIEKDRYSKKQRNILSMDEIKKIEYGKEIHKIFEYEDFKNPKDEHVIDFLKLIDDNFIDIYREYEFEYEENLIKYKGIIDLMVEYDKYILLIDYKLKNIDDINYQKQLKGYKQYIEKITNKKVDTYLYSVIDNKLVEVNND